MGRIFTVFIFFALLYSAIFLRLLYWQVWSSSRLKNLAVNQHFFRFVLPPKRGTIISSDGYPFVMNQQAYLVYAEPKIVGADGIRPWAHAVRPYIDSLRKIYLIAPLFIPSKVEGR